MQPRSVWPRTLFLSEISPNVVFCEELEKGRTKWGVNCASICCWERGEENDMGKMVGNSRPLGRGWAGPYVWGDHSLQCWGCWSSWCRGWPDALHFHSINKGLIPILWASRCIVYVSCSVPSCSTEALMVGQCFRGVSIMLSQNSIDRSIVGIANTDESETNDPKSWSRLTVSTLFHWCLRIVVINDGGDGWCGTAQSGRLCWAACLASMSYHWSAPHTGHLLCWSGEWCHLQEWPVWWW